MRWKLRTKLNRIDRQGERSLYFFFFCEVSAFIIQSMECVHTCTITTPSNNNLNLHIMTTNSVTPISVLQHSKILLSDRRRKKSESEKFISLSAIEKYSQFSCFIRLSRKRNALWRRLKFALGQKREKKNLSWTIRFGHNVTEKRPAAATMK